MTLLVVRPGWRIEYADQNPYLAKGSAAMNLLDLEHGTASLEFRSAETDWVFDQLRALGPMSITVETTCQRICVADREFVYFEEWDEPCLISSDAMGTTILTAIADRSAPLKSAFD